ncbi:DUF2339 domain-containing protein [Sphingomonas turrisvirgatae]|uniref:DUF2339 domain-containing protein n=1 Tax=Sphingomonas turrisvirgatae TaxID=1888892 RepID=A0A1E3M129_9SPHN|nr:DUF2339 domain-containing protein [Sphingomonas turrisvirgatae]ODP39678.1 hypothetical protein BFL28_08585 [Sphingomonas turrisvirgatae]
MIESILLLALVGLTVMVLQLGSRVKALSRRIDLLEREGRRPVVPPPLPAQAAEPTATRPVPTIAERAAISGISRPDAAPAAPRGSQVLSREWARPNFESLIGARLPVWIGAVALIAAGFFLVRYAIESGLLGPGVRTFAAGLFALVLVAASEAARRLPATASDPRIGQALAGAGIASGYGALYLAAALYDLVPPLPAFIVMLAVTALALFLALRHGPPTAVLALAGGFAAPLVAGYDAAGIAPLLVYLALFTGALFALAVHRGWAWLAIAATVAGFGWINFLLAVLNDGHGAAAAFAVLLALAASVALPRTGVASNWIRLAPLVAGLVQLLAFAPAMDFGLLAWSMYLTLAGATLVLAWRDERYLPGAMASVVLALSLIATGMMQVDHGASVFGAIVATAMFGGVGLAFLGRARGWSWIALGGIAGPLLIVNMLQAGRLADWQWSALAVIAAALAGLVSWRRRDAVNRRDPGLVGGTFAAALLWAVAWLQLVSAAWWPIGIIVAAVAVGWWARRMQDATLLQLPAFGLLVAVAIGGMTTADYLRAIVQSVSGHPLPYAHLPSVADGLRLLLPIAAGAVWLRTDARMFGRWRAAALTGGVVCALVLAWHLAKLPLAISSDAAFLRWGFLERALISQALLAVGWWLAQRPGAGAVGLYLFGLGLARVLWFDVLLLNPVFVPQAVGSIPLLNAAVLHMAAVAAWSWRFVAGAPWRRVGMAFTLIAVLALVRQATHGSIMTGPITTGENYGYSAALLLLALGWLGAGIRMEARDVRLAGLVLLTAVTLKVFLIDAAALGGVLRIMSFLGLGVALIGISWVYGRYLARPKPEEQPRPNELAASE